MNRGTHLLCLCLLCFGLFCSSTVQAAESTFTNSIGMEFVLIPAGSFTMGADKNFEDASDHETPRHPVTISRAFYMGKYEVTQAQWVAVMGQNPSKFKGRSNPVEQVSWEDAYEFIERLNAKEGHTRYRLPSEAEWEYAARAGSDSTFSFGDYAAALSQYAWFAEDYASGSTHPVGEKQPNAWGLYDMLGNVWEWVHDWYGETYYRNSPEVDPTGPSNGTEHVRRGGGWRSPIKYCRSASRVSYSLGYRNTDFGFRVALFPE